MQNKKMGHFISDMFRLAVSNLDIWFSAQGVKLRLCPQTIFLIRNRCRNTFEWKVKQINNVPYPEEWLKHFTAHFNDV